MKRDLKTLFQDCKMVAVVQNNASNAEDMMILRHRLHKHGITVKSFPNKVMLTANAFVAFFLFLLWSQKQIIVLIWGKRMLSCLAGPMWWQVVKLFLTPLKITPEAIIIQASVISDLSSFSCSRALSQSQNRCSAILWKCLEKWWVNSCDLYEVIVMFTRALLQVMQSFLSDTVYSNMAPLFIGPTVMFVSKEPKAKEMLTTLRSSPQMTLLGMFIVNGFVL